MSWEFGGSLSWDILRDLEAVCGIWSLSMHEDLKTIWLHLHTAKALSSFGFALCLFSNDIFNEWGMRSASALFYRSRLIGGWELCCNLFEFPVTQGELSPPQLSYHIKGGTHQSFSLSASKHGGPLSPSHTLFRPH